MKRLNWYFFTKNTKPDNNQYNNIVKPTQKNNVCGRILARFISKTQKEKNKTPTLKTQIFMAFQTEINPQ